MRTLLPMRRKELLVYQALFETSLLREDVKRFGDELAEADAARYLSRIDRLQSEALRLVQQFEEQRGAVAH
jgi:hypothetical protein